MAGDEDGKGKLSSLSDRKLEQSSTKSVVRSFMNVSRLKLGNLNSYWIHVRMLGEKCSYVLDRIRQ